MRLTIDIPDRELAIAKACPVAVAVKGIKWRASCLGGNANETGVYVIHHAGSIIYVGKTGSPSMSFGDRLRREFQEGASGGRHIYPKLAALSVPPAIMVSFIVGKEIDKLVVVEGITLNGFEKTEIFETAAIQVYQPEFQRHHEKRMGDHLKRLNIPDNARAAMMEILQRGSRRP